MQYRIPNDDEIAKIVLKVMRSEHVIESQAELLREVIKHLHRIDKNYRLSGKRLRKIALRIPEVKVEIRCKITDNLVDSLDTCPVCGERMEKIENMTLEGERITIGFRCTFCPYWTGRKLRVPTRYVFRLR